MAVTQSLVITQKSQDKIKAQSTVGIKLTSTQTGASFNNNLLTGYYWVSINGGAETRYSFTTTLPKGATKTCFDVEFTVQHNAEGKGKISVRTSLTTNISVGTVTRSVNKELTDIPRASTIGSVVGNTIGQPITVNIKRAVSDFTHQVWYRFGNLGWVDLGTGYGTTCEFTIDISKCENLPNNIKDVLQLCVRTYMGTNQIGSDTYDSTYEIQVPTDMFPTISSVTCSEAVAGLDEKFGAFIQEKSKLKVDIVTNGAGGSTIKTYATEIEKVVYLGNSIESNLLTGSGELEITVTVTDSRGRKAIQKKIITVLEYKSPTLKSWDVYRADSTGAENTGSGRCMMCVFDFEISSCGDKNDKSYKIEYKEKDADTWLPVTSGSVYVLNTRYLEKQEILDIEKEYQVRIVLKDYFKEYEVEMPITVALILMDFFAKGIAMGREATLEGYFDVDFKALFRQGVELVDENEETLDLLGKLKSLDNEIKSLNDLKNYEKEICIGQTANREKIYRKVVTAAMTYFTKPASGYSDLTISLGSTVSNLLKIEAIALGASEHYMLPYSANGTVWGTWIKMVTTKGVVHFTNNVAWGSAYTIQIVAEYVK